MSAYKIKVDCEVKKEELYKDIVDALLEEIGGDISINEDYIVLLDNDGIKIESFELIEYIKINIK